VSKRLRLLLLMCISWFGASASAADVLTNNYDNARTGANLNETTLNSANVKPETFGKIFHYAVDGPVYGQPLVVTRVTMPDKKSRDVVYVVTGSNSVYAFDAGGGETLWRNALTQLPQGNAAAPIGIFSTPVIDRGGGTIYVVAGFMDGMNAKYVLHALDLADGREKQAAIIDGSVKVDKDIIAFQPTDKRIAVQRAALAIAQDKIIVAFGGDYFEGWVFSFDKKNLKAFFARLA
jgi:hypothetical protein